MKDIKTEMESIKEDQALLAEQEQKLKTIAQLREKKDALEKKMTENKGRAFVLQKEAEEISDEVKKYQILLEAARVKQENEKIKTEAEEIEAKLAELDPVETVVRNFDKYRCFENIRELLKKRDIRIGQIETEAHCQPGYMSRLDKPTNSTDPSIEFIVTAAKKLNTNIDILVNGNLTAMTPTEEYLLGLMKNLINDTKADKISWDKETAQTLENVDYDCRDGSTSHPLFETYTKVFDEYPEPAGTKYSSRFAPFDDVIPVGNSYKGYLPNASAWLYVMSLLSGDAFENYYEVYLVNYDEKGYPVVDPICSTRETCEPIAQIVDSLYKQIEISSSHVHLNTRARTALEMYMRGEKKEG